MNPQPIAISAPALIDKACKEVNTILAANLSWLTTAYGRAEKRERIKDGQRIQYPAIYCGSGEYLALFPDDSLGNFSFFDIQDGYNLEWEARQYWRVRAVVGLVFWFNLRTVYPSTYDANTQENVKSAVLTALRNHLTPAIRFRVTRIWDRSENIYRGYSVSEIDNQFLMRPYGGFRLEGELVYEQHC